MHERYTVFILLLFFGALTTAQLIVTPPSLDFGTVRDDQIYEWVFSIENRGQRTVKLIPMPPTCGCIVSTPRPDVVSPGEEARLYVAFQPKGRRGAFRWEAAVQTDLPEQPRLVIPMQAYILRDDVLSEYVANFRIFKRGERPEVTLWLTCHEKKDFQLKKVEATVEGFTIRLLDTRDVVVVKCNLLWPHITAKLVEAQIGGFYPGPQRGYRIDITADEDIPYGRNHGDIVLTTDIPGQEKVSVRLFAYVVGDITAAPDYLSFGLVKPGTSYERKVVVSHNRYEQFNIGDVTSNLDFVTARVEVVIPDKYYYVWITLHCPKNIKAGEFRGMLYIKTDCPTHEIVEVNLQGFIPKSNR